MCRSVSEPAILYQCISHCRATSLALPHPTLTIVPWTYTLNSPQDSAPAPPPLFQLLDISFPGRSHLSQCRASVLSPQALWQQSPQLLFLPSDLPALSSVLPGLRGPLLHIPPSLYKVGADVKWTSTESSSRPSSTHPLSLLTGENKLCKTEQEVSSGESAWKISIGLVAVPLLVALVHV